ncbi:8-oxo-dGTP diphosphatase MutT [Rhodoplanes serenus]|nr:8-oxo-dGTP diphosphatase MutT [Rhodoplanes serenus]
MQELLERSQIQLDRTPLQPRFADPCPGCGALTRHRGRDTSLLVWIESAEPPVKLVLVVACALIDADGRVLLAQRPAGKAMAGLWEFPGGKVEAGERPEETLIRELDEELGIAVKEPCLAPLTFASHAYADFHLLMPLFVCRRWDGIVAAREHAALAWVRPNKLRDYPMPEADIPLIPHLTGLLL